MKCPDCGSENIEGEDHCVDCSAPLAALSGPRPEPGLKAKILAGTIADLSPSPALTVEPDISVTGAVRMMREHKIGCVLVVSRGALTGILTERDLLLGVAGRQSPEKTAVRAIMHGEPVCLALRDPVSHAFHHMAVGGYRHLPVSLPDGRFGVVSSRDLLRYLS